MLKPVAFFPTMPESLNRDIETRDAILAPFFAKTEEARKGRGYPWAGYCGGIRYYEGLTVAALMLLASQGFVDLDEQQNESPTIREFLALGIRFPNDVTFHGYAVSTDRDDYRLSVEGLEVEGTRSPELKRALNTLKKNREPDEMRRDDTFLRFWWD